MSLRERLARARQSLTESMNVLFKRGPEVDDDFWDELEETLILADMGAQAAAEIVERLRDTATRKALPDAYAVLDLLAETIEKNGLSRQTVVLVLPGEGEDAPAPRTRGPHTDHD